MLNQHKRQWQNRYAYIIHELFFVFLLPDQLRPRIMVCDQAPGVCFIMKYVFPGDGIPIK